MNNNSKSYSSLIPIEKKLITVGIPAYLAEDHICGALSSIAIQSVVDNVSIIIASDSPGSDYSFVKERFPQLDITILPCETNVGPGLARQHTLDACQTNWITFMDADDVLVSPLAIETLLSGIKQNVVEVQGVFFQEIDMPNPQNVRMMPRNDIGHPWVFGRAYNVQFLRDSGISFSALRAMEDGELNWKIRMTIEGSPLLINIINDPIYFWRKGSEHSITRIGIEENNGIPLYNFDLCQVGATAAAINAIKFCRKKNPFNGSITRFTVEMMIGHYFTYIESLGKKPLFAEQNLFNAKRFYHSCYKEIEHQIDDKILSDMYTMQLAAKGQDLIGIIPEITFFDFMKKIKEEEYRGKEEFDEIRSRLPEWVITLDKKSGVLGDEGYIHTVDEQ